MVNLYGPLRACNFSCNSKLVKGCRLLVYSVVKFYTFRSNVIGSNLKGCGSVKILRFRFKNNSNLKLVLGLIFLLVLIACFNFLFAFYFSLPCINKLFSLLFSWPGKEKETELKRSLIDLMTVKTRIMFYCFSSQQIKKYSSTFIWFNLNHRKLIGTKLITPTNEKFII